MFLKNLCRRKIRTLLTITGIGIGVSAIIGLGAMADGLKAGYNSMLTGSKADLIISQPDAFDPSYSSVDENIGREIAAMPEVADISGMLQGFANAESEPFIFVFGYPRDSFILERFQVIQGVGLNSREAQHAKGKPILIGSVAAEVMGKNVGDSIRVTGSVFRIIGVYQTGQTFEDSGLLMDISDAQELLGKPHQVSLYYLRLKDPSFCERFIKRFERQYKNLELSGAQEFANKQLMVEMIDIYVWGIGGLAILIGGVGMMNAQLMSVMERTQEIGALRALGWSQWRVLWMILAETIIVCVLGGITGVGLGYLLLIGLSKVTVVMGLTTTIIQADLLIQALVLVLVLGLVGGVYPAWRAARLQPVEALRYEGGSGGKVRRIPIGGMAVQSLLQRSGRTLLTLVMIGITVGSIMALESLIRGFTHSFSNLLGTTAEIMIRQADISDTELSVIDERIGEKIAAMPEVEGISGIIFTAIMLPDSNAFFILWGYAPNEFHIQHFNIVEGKNLTSNHQIIIGQLMAKMLKRGVGDTIDLSGSRYQITGIYESNMSWEELGGVVTLRDAQTYTGRPRKVSMYSLKLHDPAQAEAVVAKINRQFPEVRAALASEFVEQMPDMKTVDGLITGISFFAILIGGVGVLNTMLMAVFERTREIGVLRALGWRRRAVLGMILRESLLLSILGATAGIGIAFALGYLLHLEPTLGGYLTPHWDLDIFLRAIIMALILGLIGGLYPAYRATQLQPVEALRYE